MSYALVVKPRRITPVFPAKTALSSLSEAATTYKNGYIVIVVIKSTTNPDSGILNRIGGSNGFDYLAHQSVDAKCGIITDVYVTSANVNDFEIYVDRIKHQLNIYNFSICEVLVWTKDMTILRFIKKCMTWE